jgi:hypothetical protein
LGSDTATVTFSNIAATWTDLVLITTLRGSANARSQDFFVRFNSDSGSNYSRTILYGNGTSAISARDTSTTFLRVQYGPADTAGADLFSMDRLHVMNYANANVFKTCLSETNDAGVLTERQVGLWRSTSAITSLSVTAEGVGTTIKSGSTFSLFGLAAA